MYLVCSVFSYVSGILFIPRSIQFVVDSQIYLKYEMFIYPQKEYLGKEKQGKQRCENNFYFNILRQNLTSPSCGIHSYFN